MYMFPYPLFIYWLFSDGLIIYNPIVVLIPIIYKVCKYYTIGVHCIVLPPIFPTHPDVCGWMEMKGFLYDLGSDWFKWLKKSETEVITPVNYSLFVGSPEICGRNMSKHVRWRWKLISCSNLLKMVPSLVISSHCFFGHLLEKNLICSLFWLFSSSQDLQSLTLGHLGTKFWRSSTQTHRPWIVHCRALPGISWRVKSRCRCRSSGCF